VRRIPLIFVIVFAGCLSAAAQSAGDCPAITVNGPSTVTKAGDKMAFTASVVKATTGRIEYEWSVSAGTIASGQGTATIEVQTTSEMRGMNVTATLRIKNIVPGCTDIDSDVGGVAADSGCGMPFDDFGRLPRGYVKARVDNFYIFLNNDPEADGLILVSFSEKDRTKIGYLSNLYNAIVWLKQDPARVTFALLEEKEDIEPRTRFWLVPRGAETEPLTTGAILFNGKDFKRKIKTLFPINK
jgi:hypothetical protein